MTVTHRRKSRIVCLGFPILRNLYHPKSLVSDYCFGRPISSMGRTKKSLTIHERAPSDRAFFASLWTGRKPSSFLLISSLRIPIQTPFTNITFHVVDSPSDCLSRSERSRKNVFSRSIQGPNVFVDFGNREGIHLSGSCPSTVFPFRLRGYPPWHDILWSAYPQKCSKSGQTLGTSQAIPKSEELPWLYCSALANPILVERLRQRATALIF
jgi:hypothetical protein